MRFSVTSSNKARQSFDLYSGGECSIPSLPDQVRHLRFFQYQWKIKSCVSSLSLGLACAQRSLSIHNYWVTCPPPALLERVFCQRACAHLLIHSEAEPKKHETGLNCPNSSYNIFSGTAAEHTESGLQAGWMVLVVATFNHYFSRAILSPSSATLQILQFRGLQHYSSFCASRLCASIMHVMEICTKMAPKLELKSTLHTDIYGKLILLEGKKAFKYFYTLDSSFIFLNRTCGLIS